MPDNVQSDESMQSATKSLKELVTILSGIAVTIAITILMSTTLKSGVYGINRVELVPTLLFATTVLTIARFYHGNIRHLDEEYKGQQGKAFAILAQVGAPARTAADFVVIFGEALILTALSFLIRAPRQYVILLASLLLVDAIWFFFFHSGNSDRSKTWAANNLAFGVAFLVIGLLFPLHSGVSTERVYVSIIAALVLVNTAIDVINEFHFYFPTPRRGRTIFLAAPFTGMLNENNVIEDGEFRSFVEDTIRFLRQERYRVLSAHLREQWGKNLYSPADALENDLKWLSEADIVLAIVGDPPSPGVQLELGAALVMGKPIIEITQPIVSKNSYLNAAFKDHGFGAKRETCVIEFRDVRQFHEELDHILDRLLPKSR